MQLYYAKHLVLSILAKAQSFMLYVKILLKMYVVHLNSLLLFNSMIFFYIVLENKLIAKISLKHKTDWYTCGLGKF